MSDKEHKSEFDKVWKSLEEQDTTGVYKRAREMADIAIEQLEYAYNSGYKDAEAKYERPQGEWIIIDEDHTLSRFKICSNCGKEAEWLDGGSQFLSKFCPNCGAKMGGGAE